MSTLLPEDQIDSDELSSVSSESSRETDELLVDHYGFSAAKGGGASVFMNPANGDKMPIARVAELIAKHTDPVNTALYATSIILGSTTSITLLSSRLAAIRKAIKPYNVGKEVNDALKVPEITTAANDARADALPSRKVVVPTRYLLDVIRPRLDEYDINSEPTMDAVLDVMLVWSARPSEMSTLSIDEGGSVLGYSKGRNDTTPRNLLTFIPTERAVELLRWVQPYVKKDASLNPASPKGSLRYRNHIRPLGIKIKDMRVIGANHAATANLPEDATEAQRIHLCRRALRHKLGAVSKSSAEYYMVIAGQGK